MTLLIIASRIIHRVIRYFFYIIQGVVLIRTCYAPFTKSKKLPNIKNNLLMLSASQLAEKIRTQKVKCVDVIAAYIERVTEVNPILNCMVDERFEAAMKEAKTVDDMIASNPDEEYWKSNKPLFGVPLTVKETIPVEGLSNNAARSRVPHSIAKRDAETVKLLREAGAIPLLVSNTPELCLYWETFSHAHGTTNNPYDTRRTVGGSSGGEGALLGSGASVIGIGSDIGGSVRLPAFFCGIYGHKPTPGLISIDGHLPTTHDPRWNDYFVIGPLTRYAEDLPLMVKTLIPKRNKPEDLLLDQHVDVRTIKVFYMFGEGPRSILCDPITHELQGSILKATNLLQNIYNVEVEKLEMDEIADSLALSSIVLRINGIENIFQVDDDSPDEWNNVLGHIFKKLTFQSSASLTALFYGPLKIGVDLMPEELINVLDRKREKLARKFNEILGNNAVLLYPTFPSTAPYHIRMAYKFLNSAYMILFTILGLPVTQCPLGLNDDGLPLGVQIAAGPKQDRLCIAVAKALENVCGGWRPPSLE